MKLNDIRRTYIDFFVGKGHTAVPSSPLVPENDPTLLFTIAGMVQFKDVLLGKVSLPYRRAVDSQKCLRANDLDDVGYDGRHHTFFEMLGNWSFGDYFKEESISFSWEFLTKVLMLPREKLYFTVHPDDRESRGLWKKIAGVGDGRIIDIADNIWAAGDIGPFGFDTEIFYDQGPSVSGGLPGTADEDGDRYLEIWNNVFMQFEKLPDGTKADLKNRNVDTGMGLERISAVMQGVRSNFDIDLFKGIIADAEAILGIGRTAENDSSFRVLADHIRAMSFLIADGVLPSNEGRGYVLRRIMRRALRHVHMLGIREPAMYKMVENLKNEMGAQYPELSERFPLVRETIRAEEDNFGATLDAGLGILEDEMSRMSGHTLPGAAAFRLYDTYGFPLDMTADILRARGLSVDVEGFGKAMSEQKERSKRSSRFKGDAGLDKVWYDIRERVGETEFVGYDALEHDSEVLAVEGDGIILAATPFYAEMGGQVADKGSASGVPVLDVRKVAGLFVHKVADMSKFKVGDRVRLKVDSAARAATMANHSAAHLLQKALKTIVGEHVSQKGSWIGPEGFRFDFANPKGLSRDEIARVERMVNDMIAGRLDICVREMPLDEAKKTGAVALFGEKYGERVRVVDMGGKSIELCGGTHAHNTGDIKFFRIVREESIASGIRRIEAITGAAALALASKYGLDVKESPAALIVELQNAVDAEAAAAAKRRAEEFAEKKKAEAGAQAREIDSAAAAVGFEKIGGLDFASAVLPETDGKNLKGVADRMKGKCSVLALAATKGGRVSLLTAVAPGLSARVSALDLVKAMSAATGGRGGGGRPELAQAGGADAAKAADAIAAARNAIKNL